MGVRIQELPETTGINKEDVLIVEDGQGTKKGTVKQLDETLGVSQLKEDIVSIKNLEFIRNDIEFAQYADNRIFFTTVPLDNTFNAGDVATSFNDDYQVAWFYYNQHGARINADNPWGKTATAPETNRVGVCFRHKSGTDISSLTPEFVRSIVRVESSSALRDTLITHESQLENDAARLTALEADVAGISETIDTNVKPYDPEYSTANKIKSSLKRFCVQKDMPITATGRLLIEYYNVTQGVNPMTIGLFEQAEGGYKLIDMLEASTGGDIGKTLIDTGFDLDGKKTVYIGICERANAFLANVGTIRDYRWVWTDVLTAPVVNTVYASTREMTNLLAVIPIIRTTAVQVLGGRVQAVEDELAAIREDRVPPGYAHFSFDDCTFWADLMQNADTYTSIFQNHVLKDVKDLHDMYGATFTMNMFTQSGDMNVKNMPSKFAQEFRDNAHWLRFAFHSDILDTGYNNDSKAEQIASDYSDFVDGVLAMTGNCVEAIDRVTRLNYYSGSLECVRAIRDSKCGITGLLTSDDVRTSYYLDQQHNSFILSHCHYFDSTEQLHFIKTQRRLEAGDATIDVIGTKDYGSFYPMLEFFTHETLWNSSLKNKIGTYCVWLNERHFKHTFASVVYGI